MAIEVEIIEAALPSRLPLLAFPPKKVHKLAAAGVTALFAESTGAVLVRNLGDAVHIRLNAAADNTQAAAADDKSVKLAAGGDEFPFALLTSGNNYKLDVRAA